MHIGKVDARRHGWWSPVTSCGRWSSVTKRQVLLRALSNSTVIATTTAAATAAIVETSTATLATATLAESTTAATTVASAAFSTTSATASTAATLTATASSLREIRHIFNAAKFVLVLCKAQQSLRVFGECESKG